MCVVLHNLAIRILRIGLSDDKSKISKTKQNMIKLENAIFGRMMCWFVANTFYVMTQYHKVCYKKYLGPDWKEEWGGASTKMSNHTSFLDPWIISTLPEFPAFFV